MTPIHTNSTIETFTISMDNIASDHGTLNLSWDQTMVPIKINVNLRETVIPKLENALKEGDRRPYFQAAMFYYENNIDLKRAAELMALALKSNPGHIGMLYRYALILKQKGDLKEAIQAAKESLKGAQSAGAELKAEYTRLNTSLLNDLKSTN